MLNKLRTASTGDPPSSVFVASGLNARGHSQNRWYDVWALFLAWQRNPKKFGTTDTVMTSEPAAGLTRPLLADVNAKHPDFANTISDTIHMSDGSFSGFVDGSSNAKYPPASFMAPNWIFHGRLQ